MKLPSKIWVSGDDVFDRYLDHKSQDYPAYIRADLAEELARALQMAVDYGWMHSDAIDALTRYNEVKDN